MAISPEAGYTDGGRSYNNAVDPEFTKSKANDFLTLNDTGIGSTGAAYDDLYHTYGIYAPREIDYVTKRYRNGIINPYQALTTCREYLFFTKPDLNIYQQNESGKVETKNPTADHLSSALRDLPYWNSLADRYPDVLSCLQQSVNFNGSNSNKFNHLLANTVQSNLEIPGISANVIETPVNLYGVGYAYRSSSEASDDNPTFTLEFKDTRYLPVYNFFKAYEEYETLKHHGRVIPSMYYIQNKILHDQYSVYKFIVDEDLETIIYFGKYYGVISKTVPRDVFGQTNFDNGISYTVEFSAAFYDDMKPEILMEFNNLAYSYWNSLPYIIEPFNPNTGLVDNRPAKAAIVVKEPHNNNAGGQSIVVGVGDSSKAKTITNKFPTLHSKAPGQWVYKLKWKGDDTN